MASTKTSPAAWTLYGEGPHRRYTHSDGSKIMRTCGGWMALIPGGHHADPHTPIHKTVKAARAAFTA